MAIKVLVNGGTGTGKSMSLHHMKNQERWVIANFDQKDLPFFHNFNVKNLSDPKDLPDLLQQIEEHPDYDGVIIDTLSFALDQFESMYITPARDGLKAWAEYGQFVRGLFMNHIGPMKKDVIIFCHTMKNKNEVTEEEHVQAFCKGAVKQIGLEAYFSTVLYTKCIPTNRLKPNDLLHITEDDKEDRFKYVFQTRKDAITRNETVKSVQGVFDRSMIYIDNDIQQVLDLFKSKEKGN